MSKLYEKKILVRLTEKEKSEVHKKAKEANLSLSRLLVKSALSDGQVLTAEEKEEIRQLRFELRKIGINLNQIAYGLNASRRNSNPTEITASEIKSVTKEVEAGLDKLKKFL